MEDRYFVQLADGMDVYDIDGESIGAVDGLFRPAASVASTGTTASTHVEAARAEPYFRIKKGFLGFGKELFIPTSAIADVKGIRVTLNVKKDQLGEMGWDERPSWIPDM
ncbi:MAG: DUF2171 domain-containing protein [Chloroflexota bacterium]